MTWDHAAHAVATLVGIILGVGAAALLVWPLSGMLRDVWTLPMLVRLQPKLAIPAILMMVAVMFLVSDMMLVSGHVPGKLLIALALGAWPSQWIVRSMLWRRTGPPGRAEAAAVRREILGRDDEPLRPFGRPWPSYVFDVERARRRVNYEPPPI